MNDCNCKLSVELKKIPNHSEVGLTGTMVVEYVTRHATKYCPIESHRDKDEILK